MCSNSLVQNEGGISLVELLVAIGTIGVVTAIAGPNYLLFQAKARQAEAKVNLSAIYSCQKAFQLEWAGFSTHFRAIGYAPIGGLRYNLGMQAPEAVENFCPAAYVYARGGTGTKCPDSDGTAVTSYNSNNNGACNFQGANVPGFDCRILPGADGNPPSEYSTTRTHFTVNSRLISGTASEFGFHAGAIGRIRYGRPNDIWYIDADRNLINEQVGY